MQKVKNQRGRLSKILACLFIERLNNDVLLIVSLGRSGSTLLADLLVELMHSRLIFEPLHPKKGPFKERFIYPDFIGVNVENSKTKNLQRVLFSNYRSYWTDNHNRHKVCSGRVIKMVRGNMLVPWISTNLPEVKIVILIRNPLNTIESWYRSGWNPKKGKEHILNNSELLKAYLPKGSLELYEQEQDYFLNCFHFWSINYHIALQHEASIQLIKFEDLVSEDNKAKERIFGILENLGVKYSRNIHHKVVSKPSSTMRADSVFKKKGTTKVLLDLFKDKERGIEKILTHYKLDHIYPDLWHFE